MKETKYSWLSRHRPTIISLMTITVLLISSIAIIPRALSMHPNQHPAPYAQYNPSNAFGDSDDLPNSSLKSPRLSLAAGTATVSGVVKDASTGSPVANAQVGISVGTVGGGAQYTTTASDGSYSFSGIANGTYNLEANRYTISGTQPLYKDAQQMQVTVNGSASVNFSLTPISVPGSRTIPTGRAKNLIIVDYDETYDESWFTDAQSMANSSPATHQLAQSGVISTETWTQYGWSPIDHYQIAVGSYPAWRTPDAPGKVWGQPDGLDTNLWYDGTEVFGQESIFDVAKSYGMSTAVIGGNDYPTGHITDVNVDQIALGQNINGVPTQWVTEVQNFITANANNPNGFLVYMPVTEAEGRSVESTSPDSSGGLYQQASGWDDQAFGQLYTWLQQNNYTSNSAISITADEAENDHTSYDNFYGLGSTGMGTTRHVPFVLAGPGIVSGQTYTGQVGIDEMSTNYMYALGLPAPVDSRGKVIPNFFTTGGTPLPTPTTTGAPSPTPTTNSGGYSLKLGNSSNQQGVSIAYQMVTIPSGTRKATLSFYYWPSSNDSSTYGWQEADVIGSNGNVLRQLFVNTTTDQVWVQMTFDLSSYIGQTIGIQFLDHEDSGGASYYTYMYVDDVSLKAS